MALEGTVFAPSLLDEDWDLPWRQRGKALPDAFTGKGYMASRDPGYQEQAVDWLNRNVWGDTREGRDKAEWLTGGLLSTPGISELSDAYAVGQDIGEGNLLGAGTGLAMAMAPGPSPKKIKAYHGSPHDFERFSMEKIGTGEGAQAYGHGLYFAGNEGVAKSYRDTLAKMPGGRAAGNKGYKIDGQIIAENDLTPVQTKAIAEVQMYDGDVDKALDINRRYLAHAKRDDPELLNEIAALKGKTIEDYRPGSMYEVEINADPESFLDWDKPLSGQSEKIRKLIGLDRLPQKPSPEEVQALFALAKERGVSARDMPEYKALEQRLDTANEAAWDEIGISSQGSHMRPEELSGGMYYQGLEQKRIGPDQIWNQREPGSQDVSGRLKQAGIPGIRYLDQGSRNPVKMKELADDLAQYREAAKHWAATGNEEKLKTANKQIEVLEKRLNQTSNYVLFDDALIEILRKYGIVGLLGGMGGAAALSPDQAQAQQ